MQITMFLMLGLQVFPARLLPIASTGLLVSLFLILVARPVSVYLALAFSRFSFREQTLIAWVGLRGAVPIVLATFPVLAGIQQADTIFHLVFFIALTSVLLQGPPIPWITRMLGLDRSPANSGH
jgi:cell volume regulation protein A